MEEKFFAKRLTKGKAILNGLLIILVDGILFFGINNIHNFEIVPLTLSLAFVAFIVFLYGIATMSAPFNYENCKKYLEERGPKIDTPYMLLYKKN